ncbi:MAG: radical SAM protein [Verrucomicrobiota bacterium]|nr:radical SAM protein [Verrucomicrobiota bacterium]
MSRGIDSYPSTRPGRDRWILRHRSPRATVDPWRPISVAIENEPSVNGGIERVLVMILAGSECPWRCVMCDLWKNTIAEPMPQGAVPAQINAGLAVVRGRPEASDIGAVKIYNSGSFFDRRSVPPADYQAIARLVGGFRRVIVECHPNLVDTAVLKFRDLIQGKLEIAMGLETADPDVLVKLNKRLTPAQFARSARFLVNNGIDVRAFVLIQPPFTRPETAVDDAVDSMHFAFNCGASIVALIPTRAGNGAMEELAATGDFVRPRLATFEKVLETAIQSRRGRVIADLWSLEQFADCPACFGARRSRLEKMNLTQSIPPTATCSVCDGC